MNKLQQLIEAAKAAIEARKQYELSDGMNDLITADDLACHARFRNLANPATILELCALLTQAEGALKGVMSATDKVADKQHAFDVANDNFSDPRPEGESLCQALIAATEADNTANEALAAIKQWKQT
jgi:hypothetical protein